MNKENSVLDLKKIRKISLLNIIWQWEIILLFIFIIVIIINSNLSPYFLDYTNLMNTTFNFIEKAIIALPMIFVIICGDIDISVASIIALSSVFMGMASQAGVNTLGLVAIGLFSGTTAGFLNGFIITKFGIPAIAVTLGSMSLFRGIAYVILGDKAFTKYPASFAFFGQEYIGNTMIPFELVLFFILAIIFGTILHKTTFGRKVFAIGNNSTAAHFSGIPVNRIRLIIFAVTGLCSGLASILLTSRIGSTRPNIAYGWELEIITTVVLGGVAITGGKGNIFGVIISIFIIGFLIMNIVVGLLLILAIMLPELLKRLKPKNSFGNVKK
ncbi:branched-chain amino acid ABC transporter permease [Candidatus Atribacteria bacterium 4572_76]|nr:MAG: branched-chain amino acid ABC transporter permease [Candidatus Atribacteria bacterium 4572_76]